MLIVGKRVPIPDKMAYIMGKPVAIYDTIVSIVGKIVSIYDNQRELSFKQPLVLTFEVFKTSKV